MTVRRAAPGQGTAPGRGDVPGPVSAATRGGGGRPGERGSVSIWVLVCGALLILVSYASAVLAEGVLARHRAEAAADLAALAAAGQIGVSGDVCPAAARIARANSAALRDCQPALAPDGRSGVVRVRVGLRVHLPVVGAREVVASARAGRAAAIR
jgi:secretion/DNA translocation related TadE-like protein